MLPPFYDFEAENVEHKDYGELKLSPEELHIPGARSNVWPKSWKRFMVDFMYGRGLVMMYPNLPGQQGFATALQETGQHIGKKQISVKDPRVADLLDSLSLKNQEILFDRLDAQEYPRVTDLLVHWDLPMLGNLPTYGDLAVFGLFLQPTTHEQLADEGIKFLQGVSEICTKGCAALIRSWARPGIPIASRPEDGDEKSPPPICVADLYTSASTASSRPVPSKSTERYLLFEPQYGANNQLHAVIQAYYWARALGRRLVLPPIIMPRVSAFDAEDLTDKWLSFEKFFHFSASASKADPFPPSVAHNSQALPPIDFKEFMSLNKKPWRLIRATREAVFDRSHRILTSALHKKDIEVINLRHLYDIEVPIQKVQQYLGGCDDDVLAFDGLFFAKVEGVDPRKLMPDVMQLSNGAAELSKQVKDKFVREIGTSNYACYHVRLGDYASMW
jgi:hypothetical protein